MTSKQPFESLNMPPAKKIKLTSDSRNFKEAWKLGNSWLTYDSKLKVMFCDVCIKAKNSNSFTAGCSVLKKESVTKHSKNKEHVNALAAGSESKHMEAARVTALSKSDAAITSAMKNLYFAAQNDVPLVLVPALNQLCLDQCPQQFSNLVVDGHTSYTHNSSINDFLFSVGHVLEVDFVEKVKNSAGFSLMLDESTDVSVHQNMIVFIRILESNCFGQVLPTTYFLGIAQLERSNADSIYGSLLKMLDEKHIDVSKLRGFSTDGAAVMIGNKSGVVTKLKSLGPGILSTHCIAHRLALSCCTGADKIPYLVKFQEILNSVYKFFNNSPKNMAKVGAIQSALDAQRLRFKEMFHTRWLSFEGSVDAMLKNYSPLISVFLEENSGKSLSLYKPITCFKFLYVAHFMADATKHIACLSKMYQKKDIDFSMVTPLLQSTVDSLEKLRDLKNGQTLQSFLKVVPSEPSEDTDGLLTFEFLGHTIRDSSKQRSEAVSICDSFISGVVSSLTARFSSTGDSLVMASLGNLFNPTINSSLKESDVQVVSDYLDTVGFQGYLSEVQQFSIYLSNLSLSNNNLVTGVRDSANVAIRNQETFPACAEAARRLLLCPVSTVDCERGFSRQNLVKTALRNRLNIRTLDNLLRINIDGPDMKYFDYSRSFQFWASQKSRRILH